MDSFVYCWSDMATKMLYVGVHKGSKSDGYVCSSKYMMEEYSKRPQDFKRQIIANGSYDEMLRLEINILKSADAAKSDAYYNKHNGDGLYYIKNHSAETKTKMSIAAKNVSKETRLKRSKSAKIRIARDGNPAQRDDARQKLSIAASTRFANGNQAGKNNHSWKGYIVTPYGTFETLNEAAAAEGISRSSMYLKVRDESNFNYYRRAI
jgi:hypothetical protein